MKIRVMNWFSLLVFVSVVLPLMGCEGTKEQLGLNRQAPDEFAVVKRAPLSLPPDYALRPPAPGAPRPQEQAASQQAKAAVLGGVAVSSGSVSDAERTLLQLAGAEDADPAIRRKVDAETATRVDKNKPVVKKLLSIGDDEVPARVVDPVKEAERLQEGGEGETPSIDD